MGGYISFQEITLSGNIRKRDVYYFIYRMQISLIVTKYTLTLKIFCNSYIKFQKLLKLNYRELLR